MTFKNVRWSELDLANSIRLGSKTNTMNAQFKAKFIRFYIRNCTECSKEIRLDIPYEVSVLIITIMMIGFLLLVKNKPLRIDCT